MFAVLVIFAMTASAETKHFLFDPPVRDIGAVDDRAFRVSRFSPGYIQDDCGASSRADKFAYRMTRGPSKEIHCGDKATGFVNYFRRLPSQHSFGRSCQIERVATKPKTLNCREAGPQRRVPKGFVRTRFIWEGDQLVNTITEGYERDEKGQFTLKKICESADKFYGYYAGSGPINRDTKQTPYEVSPYVDAKFQGKILDSSSVFSANRKQGKDDAAYTRAMAQARAEREKLTGAARQAVANGASYQSEMSIEKWRHSVRGGERAREASLLSRQNLGSATQGGWIVDSNRSFDFGPQFRCRGKLLVNSERVRSEGVLIDTFARGPLALCLNDQGFATGALVSEADASYIVNIDRNATNGAVSIRQKFYYKSLEELKREPQAVPIGAETLSISEKRGEFGLGYYFETDVRDNINRNYSARCFSPTVVQRRFANIAQIKAAPFWNLSGDGPRPGRHEVQVEE